MIIRELLVKLGFDFQPKGMDQAERRIAGFSKSAEQKIKSFRNFSLGFAAAISAPIILLGKSIFETSSNFEQLNVAFETMIGSSSKAKIFVDQLKTFAETTPFEIENLAEASKRLLAYGFSAEEILPTLKDLGNISAGVGMDKLPNLITALGQIRSKKVLSGEELKQLTETGVPIIDELAKVTGISASKIVDNTKDLRIGYDKVALALRNLSGDGGKFQNLMEKQSKTLGGQTSNLKDSFNLLKQEMGDLFKDEAMRFIKFLRETVQWFRSLNPQTKKFIGYMAILAVVIGGVLTVISLGLISISSLLTIMSAIPAAWPFILISLAILAVIAALTWLYFDLKEFIELGDSKLAPSWFGLIAIFFWLKEKFSELKNEGISFYNWTVKIFNKAEEWRLKVIEISKEFAKLNLEILKLLKQLSNPLSLIFGNFDASGFKNQLNKFLGSVNSISAPVNAVIPQSGIGSKGDVQNNFKVDQKITINTVTSSDAGQIAEQVRRVARNEMDKTLRTASRSLQTGVV